MAMEWLSSINSTQWADIFATMMFWIGIIFWLVITAAIIWYFFYMSKFNIPIHIYDVVGSEKTLRFIRKGKERVNTKDNVSKLFIFGIKQSQEAPSNEYYQLSTKGRLINLLRDGTEYKPFKISANPGTISISDHHVRFWMTKSVNSLVKKYTELSFFQKYGTYIVFIFGMLVLGWMYYILIDKISGEVDKQLQLASQLNDVITSRLKP